MMCSTGVILSIPLNSPLSQKHKLLFSVRETEGGVVLLPRSVLTRTWKPQSHRGQKSGSYPVLEAPRLGSECQEAASCGLGVSLWGLDSQAQRLKGGRAEHEHLAGAHTVIAGKLWPKICHV